MAHFEDVESVAIMPSSPLVYAHALSSSGRVYAFMDGKWLRLMSRPSDWSDRVGIIPDRKIYYGKFIIKAWVE